MSTLPIRTTAECVNSGGVIETFAGDGNCDDIGDGGSAIGASLRYPWGVAIDGAGAVFITESGCRVRKVASGVITTAAGTGACGFGGDGGQATGALTNSTTGVAVDQAGDVFFSDTFNGRVRSWETPTEAEATVLVTANADQANIDAVIGNGPTIPGDDKTGPHSDTIGDACDSDLDNDGLPDVRTPSRCHRMRISQGRATATRTLPAVTSPTTITGTVTGRRGHRRRRRRPLWDTDNDGVLDGVECQLGTNPRRPSSKPSGGDVRRQH